MKNKYNPMVKICACCFMVIFTALAAAAAAAIGYMCINIGAYRSDYQNTERYHGSISSDSYYICRYYSLNQKSETESLNAEEQYELDYSRRELFPPAGTNTVWFLTDQSGKLLLSNLENTADAFNRIASLTGNRYKQRTVQQDETTSYYVVIGLRANQIAEDKYSIQLDEFRQARHWFLPLIVIGGVFLLLGIVLFGYMIAAVGHKKGVEGITLCAFDRIWVEPLLLIEFLLAVFFLSILANSTEFVQGMIITAFILIVSLPIFFSFVRRYKAKMLYKTSLMHLLVRLFRTVMRRLPSMAAVIGILAAYGLLQLVLIIAIANGASFAVVLWFLSNIGMIAFVCVIAVQLDDIRKAISRMGAGELGELIRENTVPFFKGVARNINSTSNAINLAVERAMQSERMKTELIANVSHDIKTPLTSIISYVDLLKTTEIKDEKALEYINVLDRKSRRLGQLMSDLVDASKVTTGNVSVHMEVINLGELVKQAGGEFESRLEQHGITLICNLPDTPVCVHADGRHMWRVLDNLFGNASKYALDGTRVYVDVSVIGQDVLMSIKNISRDQLNIRPDELMERFVRGDRSRYTEGSGLGLSIARSLVELQQGAMDILIDGDLFKVVIRLKKSDQPCEAAGILD